MDPTNLPKSREVLPSLDVFRRISKELIGATSLEFKTYTKREGRLMENKVNKKNT